MMFIIFVFTLYNFKITRYNIGIGQIMPKKHYLEKDGGRTVWNYLWPILIVVTANSCYHICAKSMPNGIQPFMALTVTYTTAAIFSLVLFLVTSPNKNFVQEFHKINWTSIVLGVSILALEFGYIQVYRAGWNVSVGSLVANIALACVLIVVGVFLYKEHISINQMIGIVLCIIGIIFINK